MPACRAATVPGSRDTIGGTANDPPTLRGGGEAEHRHGERRPRTCRTHCGDVRVNGLTGCCNETDMRALLRHQRECCIQHTATSAPVGVAVVTGTGSTSHQPGFRPYGGAVDNRGEVRDFLTTRRARITPEQAGLPDYGGKRRVPGLRRTEVAALAG